MGLILINLENIAVPSIHQGFVSAELCAALLHNEDTNLLPKTTLEKSTMKSSGILKEKSKTKQLGFFFCNHSYIALPEKTPNLLQNTKNVLKFSIFHCLKLPGLT